MNSDINYNPDIQWLTDNDGLAHSCAQWSECEELGIDTEFVRTRTFFAQLGLVQVSAAGSSFLIDPLTVSELGPFWELMSDSSVTKVLHSGSEDLEIFVRLSDRSPRPLFDTQVAAGLAGMGPSLSYQALVQEICGVELSKAETRSNWLHRPLSPSQVYYAAMDVGHLSEIRAVLWQRLGELGRQEWLLEDMERICDQAELSTAEQDQFQKFKLAWKLDSTGAEILWQLVCWREKAARRRDIPRNRVLESDQMLDIARAKPANREALRQCTNLSHGNWKYHADELITAVTKALALPAEKRTPAPPPPLDISSRSLMKTLKNLVVERADDLSLAPELLCSKKDLTEIVRNGELAGRMLGWRKDVLGNDLITTMEKQA